MRRIMLVVVAVFLLSACGKQHETTPLAEQGAMTWQEQYDLGMRYLTEGNYTEAIIAFTAAIEIDPKQAEAYIGRGDAYVGVAQLSTEQDSIIMYYDYAINDYSYAQTLGATNLDGNIAAIRSAIEELNPAEAENSYGTTSFTQRPAYAAFETLSAREQATIRQVLAAAVSNDKDGLLSVGKQMEDIITLHPNNYDPLFPNLYTICDGYKVAIEKYEFGFSGEEAYQTFSYAIEIRPQDGEGYYIEVRNSSLNDLLKAQDGTYNEYYKEVSRAACHCVDWQWNGQLRTEDFGLTKSNGLSWLYGGITSGTLKDGLCNGSFAYYGGYNVDGAVSFGKGQLIESGYSREANATFENGYCTYASGAPFEQYIWSADARVSIQGTMYGYGIDESIFYW